MNQRLSGKPGAVQFSVDLSGSPEARQDRGRHHGALACKFIRDTGHNALFAHMNEIAVYSPEYAEIGDPYRVGMAQAVADIAISGPGQATIHQRSMLPFYQEAVAGLCPETRKPLTRAL